MHKQSLKALDNIGDLEEGLYSTFSLSQTHLILLKYHNRSSHTTKVNCGETKHRLPSLRVVLKFFKDFLKCNMLIIKELRCLELVNIKLSTTLLSVRMTVYGLTCYGDFPLHELLAFYLCLTGFLSNPPEVNLNFCCRAHPEQDEGWWFYCHSFVAQSHFAKRTSCSETYIMAQSVLKFQHIYFPNFTLASSSPLYFPPNTHYTYTQTCVHTSIVLRQKTKCFMLFSSQITVLCVYHRLSVNCT